MHSRIVEDFIRSYSKRGYPCVKVECPYCYYGNKGVVDVILRNIDYKSKMVRYLVCEIKSRNFSIGDALRQVNKTKQYFFKDKSVNKDLISPFKGFSFENRFPLVLHANDLNMRSYTSHISSLSNIEVWFFHPDRRIEQRFSRKASGALFEHMKTEIRRIDFTPVLDSLRKGKPKK